MLIIQDTREQYPLDFSIFPCTVERAGLKTGDYSIRGLEDSVGAERKSEPDLLGSLTQGRERFEAELARARGFACFFVVCETTWERLARGQYASRMTPQSCLQSIIGLSMRFGVPFLMVGSHRAAAYVVYHSFRHYLKQREEELRAILKHREVAA